jgi:hypothetical protein
MSFIPDKPEGCIDVGNQALRVNVVAGGGSGGGPATIADGASVVEGATTDAAVTSNATGTISGKLRGLVAILADIWDSVNHRIAVALPAATVTTLTPPTAAAIASALANPLPVSLATAPTTPVTNAGLTNLDVALSTRLKPADTLAGVTTVATVTSITNPVATNADTAIDGTAAPAKGILVLGQSDDATPIYAPLPLAVGGESLVVSGTLGVNNFPATQPVSGTVAVSNPNVNYSLETGNLAALVSNTRNDAQIVDLLTMVIARLDAINMTLAHEQGNYINPDDLLVSINTVQ